MTSHPRRITRALLSVSDKAGLIEFAASLRDQTRLSIGEASFDIASCRIIRDGS